MTFTFNESVVLTVPNVKNQYQAFKESDHRETNKLIVEIAAIHVGLTSNFNMYSKEALEASLKTWVDPYPRPIILNHDQLSESIGRVMASRMEYEADGTAYVRLQAGITDPLAIERVLDERYLTGSVGGGAEKALCSICGVDWASDESAAKMGSGTLPCRHKRGAVYEGKVAYFDLHEIKFKEYSFVNVPADEHSGVRLKSIAANLDASSEQWSHTVQMYSLNMNKPSVVEMSESEGSNILDELSPKKARATYTALKGTFLTISAYDMQEFDSEKSESVNSDDTIKNDLVQDLNSSLHHNLMNNSQKENNMATNAAEEIETEEEDILAVSEQLATDLANVKADEAADGENKTETSEEESTETSDELSDEDTTADPEGDEEENKEGEEGDDEGQQEQLVTSEDEGATEEVADEQANESEAASDKGSAPEGQEGSPPDVEADPTRNISAEALDALTEENAKLKEKVANLSKALHNMLVERVVDAKISRGLAESSARAELIEEHSTRTASSLADTLKDINSLSVKVTASGPVPQVEEKTLATGKEDNVVTASEQDEEIEESEVEPDPTEKLEEFLYLQMSNKLDEALN